MLHQDDNPSGANTAVNQADALGRSVSLVLHEVLLRDGNLPPGPSQAHAAKPKIVRYLL
jgi:hypothetical protein